MSSLSKDCQLKINTKTSKYVKLVFMGEVSNEFPLHFEIQRYMSFPIESSLSKLFN